MFQTIGAVSGFFMNGKTHYSTLVATDPEESQGFFSFFGGKDKGNYNEDNTEVINFQIYSSAFYLLYYRSIAV